MFISDITSSGSIPTLEAMVHFSAQRQKLIANNIANISTPNYQSRDVSVADFRRQLRDAVDERRDQFGGERGALRLRSTHEIEQDASGRLTLTASSSGRNVLFHDRNNRDLEGLMQDMVENAMSYRVATELLRGRYNLLNTAISERV